MASTHTNHSFLFDHDILYGKRCVIWHGASHFLLTTQTSCPTHRQLESMMNNKGTNDMVYCELSVMPGELFVLLWHIIFMCSTLPQFWPPLFLFHLPLCSFFPLSKTSCPLSLSLPSPHPLPLQNCSRKLNVPTPWLDQFITSLMYSGPTLRNSLPVALAESITVVVFKCWLFMHYAIFPRYNLE